MDDLYIGSAYRKTREFRNAGVLTDLTALTVDIKQETGGAWLVTTAETTFHDLNILANKISTGKYFAKVTPDAAEAVGIYLIYWTATYGTGGSAETFTVGPDVICIHSEADIPSLSDNYLSLDALSKEMPDIFNLENPAHMLKRGWVVSRDIDAMLDERFDTPVQKNSSGVYDQPIIDAAVAFTIARALQSHGRGETADKWETRALKFVDDLLEGRRRLSVEVTRDEVGFGPPRSAATNASTNVELEVYDGCVYGDIYRRTFKIQIDAAGVIGTATFKYSRDAGGTWEETLQATDDEWIYPSMAYGLAFRFRPLGAPVDLALGDSWTIEAIPEFTQPSVSKRGIRTAELKL